MQSILDTVCYCYSSTWYIHSIRSRLTAGQPAFRLLTASCLHPTEATASHCIALTVGQLDKYNYISTQEPSIRTYIDILQIPRHAVHRSIRTPTCCLYLPASSSSPTILSSPQQQQQQHKHNTRPCEEGLLVNFNFLFIISSRPNLERSPSC